MPGPLLPLDTFHSILASLLMNEISTVSAVAQEALVRFVQMLQDDSLKTPESPRQNSENLDAPTNSEEVKRPHVHRHYDLPQRARELIRDDIVDEIVLALFRMDRRPAAYASLWKNQPMRSHDNSSQHEVKIALSAFVETRLTVSYRIRPPSSRISLTILWLRRLPDQPTSRMLNKQSLLG